jgi:cyclophilin family peptidyl-prolyl cis-trans isomerase
MNRSSVPAILAALLIGTAVTASAQSSAPAATPPSDTTSTAPGATPEAAATPSVAPTPVATPPATPAVAGIPAVVLETTQGNIVIQLDEKNAPRTAANFKKLVKQGFYDGTYFHRVISNFMIQGGDPNTKNALPADDGQGGPGYTVPAEIKLPHVRGAVATARLGDGQNPTRASSGSQFFIDLANLKSLDQGGYTVFGQVISGMEAVDKIAKFASDATLPAANGGGKNPGKKALIKKARFVASWTPPGAAAPASTAPDTTRR